MPANQLKNLLIAEDNSGVAETMVMTLQLFNYHISAVVSRADEAIQKAQELKPDLVIMDVMLGDHTDGIHAGRHIQKTLSIPVLYVTGYREKAASLEREGAVPLLKPFNANDLKIAIGAIFYTLSLRYPERKPLTPDGP
ncbi:MAG: hypothetical protein A3G91_04290 [Omnitrophica WOR_2 bacterium RIFCSPLOWO2_12_FULL_50_9]|nr:MAG: hypothetical protein A3D87_00350 [Omnitrophica WOR_2 bacterium RIFCSPHIGHO2_02_FULL_50_17]OGX41137.1 MAG: hypothetical protein A3G91_04290 [Omnitrophica WOR_2 bacterium RIFCSPLOWO2_12_FULL_50_9]